MFILVQIPLADLRPLLKGQLGRVTTPDWSADDPGQGFVRGFGKVAARNDSAYGLFGERFFADFDNAVRLRAGLAYRQEGWPCALEAQLRFRRLYYDGAMAGRFEFGFLIADAEEDMLAGKVGPLSIDVRKLAAAALALPVGVSAPGCEEQATTIGGCGELLCQAYVAATTKAGELNSFPPAETCGVAVALGTPLVQIRLANGLQADVGRDRGEIDGADGKLFVTSAEGSRLRNVIACLSESGSQKETSEERAVRVLFSHLLSLLFAQGHFLTVQDALGLRGREPLLGALTDMIARLERLQPAARRPGENADVTRALQVFGAAHAGRAEMIQASLEKILAEASRPGPVKALLAWTDSLITHGVQAATTAAVDRVMKGGS